MSLPDANASLERASTTNRVRTTFGGGLVFYLVSFVLPAYQADNVTVYGYELAYLTLVASVRVVDPAFWNAAPARRLMYDLLATLPGWANVLAPLALLGGRWAKSLRVLALLTTSASLLFFDRHFAPHIGFFAWLVGLVLMLFARELAKVTGTVAARRHRR